MKELEEYFNVPRGTSEKINRYIDSILEWNKTINLVSRKENRDDIYQHVLNSLQLSEYIKNKKDSIFDIGSGAGLPGLVLSIAGYTNCNLVEISSKKCAFLQYIVSELKLSNKILNLDIRVVKEDSIDYIISKAVAEISTLMTLSEHLIHNNIKFFTFKK